MYELVMLYFMVTIRRNKLEIFFDILNAINSGQSGFIKPTQIQLRVKISYDKMMKNLKELEKKEFIHCQPYQLTDKGEKFIQDFEGIKQVVTVLKNKYLDGKLTVEKKSYPNEILVVDDDEDLLNMLSTMIEHFGYQVVLARDGNEAITEYGKHQPDLVLMDINMPKKDGYDSFFDLTKNFPDAKVIFMTGYQDYSKWKKAKAKGAIYLMQKPFTSVFLKELISRHVKNPSI